MKSLKIITKTDAGVKALKTHLETTKKGELRAARVLGYKQEVISLGPFTLMLSLNWQLQRLIEKDHLTMVINKALENNGAKEGIDYVIEVEE